MKTLGRLVALALSTTVLVAVPSVAQAAPAPAERAAVKLATIKTWSGAKQQACKKPTANGRKWQVLTRVVNGKQAEVGVGLQVLKGDKVVAEFSTPIVKRGATSKTGSVKISKSDKRFTLVASQFQEGMGGGGPVKLKKIRRC